jgi:sterol desaturase/sphingolipid hydroxylase (fatty acid hydroxylase superfamily)
MFISLVGATVRGLLFAVTGSSFAADLSGYWLHRLMHSDQFPALTRVHRLQHFL